MDFLLSIPGRLLAWVGGPLLVLYALFLCVTSWPWSGFAVIGYSGVVAFCLVLAAWMIAPVKLWWGAHVLAWIALGGWLTHTAWVLLGPLEYRAPIWVPLVTGIFIGLPPLMFLTRNLRIFRGTPLSNLIVFKTSLPPFEAGVADTDDLGLPYGKPALVALVMALEARGFQIQVPVEQDNFYGWDVFVRRPGCNNVFILIQGDDEELLLIVKEHRGLWGALTRKKRDEMEAVIVTLLDIIRTDARFSDGQRHDDDSYQQFEAAKALAARARKPSAQ